MSDLKYNVVHIITSGEYKAPLIAVQVFDRAQVQATTEGDGKPQSVSVWIMAPMRETFTKKTKEIVHKLRLRCPDIKITMVGGIGRFNNWPSLPKLIGMRRQLKGRAIYHCRGESASGWAYLVKQKFPNDAIALDIRGYTPLEKYVDQNIFNVKDLSAAQKSIYDANVAKLKRSIKNADAVFTVSEPLLQYLIRYCGAPQESALIPCCVKNTIPDTNREKIRQELNIQNKNAILYLGGTQRYQHLEDLVIPFIKSAITQSESHIGVFITQNKDKMATLLKTFGVNEDKIRIISVEQNKVGDYLTAMDIGLLLRSPNDLNSFSQPVKFGEYLSAGLPVVVEEGTGEISSLLNKYKIGYVVSLTDKKNKDDFDKEVMNVLKWCESNSAITKINTKKFVEENYTWRVNVPKERKKYLDTLQKMDLKN